MSYKPRVLTVSEGGQGNITLTNHGVILGNGTSPVTQLAAASTGTIAIGNTGADLSFSATPTVTSVTIGGGSTLNNYSTGTFSPTIAFTTPGTSTFTYSAQVGKYVKIGNTIFISMYVALSNYSAGTAAGSLQFASLPFTSANVTNQTFTFACNIQNTTFAAGTLSFIGRKGANNTTAGFQSTISGSLVGTIVKTDVSTTSTFSASGWYTTT